MDTNYQYHLTFNGKFTNETYIEYFDPEDFERYKTSKPNQSKCIDALETLRLALNNGEITVITEGWTTEQLSTFEQKAISGGTAETGCVIQLCGAEACGLDVCPIDICVVDACGLDILLTEK